MATNIKKIKTSAGDHDIDAKLWNGMSTDSPNFTSSVGISGKSYIRFPPIKIDVFNMPIIPKKYCFVKFYRAK